VVEDPATAAAANILTSANAAIVGDVAVPVTCTQVPVVVTMLLSTVDNCPPPEQLGEAYHATLTRAFKKFVVVIGARIKPDHE
jgi:hypothetical protein